MKTLLHVVVVLAAGLAMARPSDIRSANLEPSRGGKPRPPVLVPPDATNNVSQNCPVTASAAITLQDSSDRQTPLGELPCINDGNKEHDNSSGLGVGKDKEYIECYEGRAIEVDGVCARYLRFYSNGCTETPVNRYTEIEVYGRAPVDRDRSHQDKPRVRLRIEFPRPILT